MSEKKFTDLPVNVQLEIIQRMDTKSKLQLARASKCFRKMILCPPDPPVSLWSHVEVTATSGERTLPLLAKFRPITRSLVVNLRSGEFLRECSRGMVFPVLTDLDVRVTSPGNWVENLTFGSAFPSLRKLRLDGKYGRGLLWMLPTGFASLTLGSHFIMDTKSMNGIFSKYPALNQFTLAGCWEVYRYSPYLMNENDNEAVLQALSGLQKVTVHSFLLCSVNAGFLDKLTEWSIAEGVRQLEIHTPDLHNSKFSPSKSPTAFYSLTTLKLDVSLPEHFVQMSDWLSAICGLETLETWRLSGCCLGTKNLPTGPDCFWNNTNGMGLSGRLSTFGFTFKYGDVVNRNVMRFIVCRAAALKNVAIFSAVPLNPVGFVDLITGLCHGNSQIEFLSVEGTQGFEGQSISEDQRRRLCSHLIAKAHELKHLKLLHFAIRAPPQCNQSLQDQDFFVFNLEGCSMAALKQRLPLPECVVRFNDGTPGYTPKFSDAEKVLVRELHGFTNEHWHSQLSWAW